MKTSCFQYTLNYKDTFLTVTIITKEGYSQKRVSFKCRPLKHLGYLLLESKKSFIIIKMGKKWIFLDAIIEEYREGSKRKRKIIGFSWM